MNTIKKLLKNKKIRNSIISLVATGALLLFSVLGFGSLSYAWLTHNKRVNAGGVSVSVTDSYLRFGDTIETRAVMNGITVSEKTYKTADGDNGTYYLFDKGTETFILDSENNKQSINFTSIFPGEYVELSFYVTCAESQRDQGYQIKFKGLSGSDIFTIGTGDDAKIYSVLGVYRLKAVTTVNGIDETETDMGFLASYEDGAVINDSFTAYSADNWDNADESGRVNVKLRLYVDLEQYANLSGTTSNLLSEKSIKIGVIELSPKEN